MIKYGLPRHNMDTRCRSSMQNACVTSQPYMPITCDAGHGLLGGRGRRSYLSFAVLDAAHWDLTMMETMHTKRSNAVHQAIKRCTRDSAAPVGASCHFPLKMSAGTGPVEQVLYMRQRPADFGAILHPHEGAFKQQRPLPQRGTCQTAHDRTGVSDFPQKLHERHVHIGVCRLQRLLMHTRCMSTVAPRCQGADRRVQTGECRETEWLAAHLVHAEALANTPQLRHIFRHLLHRLRLVRQQLPLCKSI